jgi:hypothetical protein
MADELIRASLGTAHHGKGDVITQWTLTQITLHEMAYDPFVLDWIAA